ncbi:hypothetical protein [Haladaptatus sp. NG-WS-4]
MTNYGFVIDNRRCIGCYACTVVCKTEHDDPIGALEVNDDDVFRIVFRGRFTPAETEGEQWRLASKTITKSSKRSSESTRPTVNDGVLT